MKIASIHKANDDDHVGSRRRESSTDSGRFPPASAPRGPDLKQPSPRSTPAVKGNGHRS